MILRISSIFAALILASCAPTPQVKQIPRVQAQPAVISTGNEDLTSMTTMRQIVARVEPIGEQICRDTGRVSNCDFKIQVDTSTPDVVNAYQTLEKDGRPLVVFSIGLLKAARNTDEVAFVLGHEMAHHIAGHIQQRRGSAGLGGLILGGLIAYSGGSVQDVDTAFDLGAAVGSRVYSKDHELQADEIGTMITYYAGYDPVRGSKFFTRIPDPGDKFLGSHPPNAARIDRVNRTMARVR